MSGDFLMVIDNLELDENGEVNNGSVSLNDDTLIDFSAISAATATPELDLRIAYEANPPEFIQNYIFDLGLMSHMTPVDAAMPDNNFPNYSSSVNGQDVPVFDYRDLLGSPEGDIAQWVQQERALSDIGDNNDGDVFVYENPSRGDTINGFINVGNVHDKVDLSQLLNNLGLPNDEDVRTHLVHVVQQGDDVQLTVDGLPNFSLTFMDSASNRATDFVVGTDIIVG